MKNTVVKIIVLCTLALTMGFVGAQVHGVVDTGVEVCHDGPQHDTLFF